jgi:hypothetical protein
MPIFGRAVTLLLRLLARRHLRWVEISLERAWSRDTVPRLFDVGKS